MPEASDFGLSFSPYKPAYYLKTLGYGWRFPSFGKK